MFKRKSADGSANIYLLVAAILLIVVATFFLNGYFDKTPSKAFSVKIIQKNNMLTASYKSSESVDSENEDIINWYIDGVLQSRFKGAQAILVPPVTGRTVEIECSVKRVLGTTLLPAVKSRKYLYYRPDEIPLAHTAATGETGVSNVAVPDEDIAGPTSRPALTDPVQFSYPIDRSGLPGGTVENQTAAVSPASVFPHSAPDEASNEKLEPVPAGNIVETPPAPVSNETSVETKPAVKFGTGISFKSNSTERSDTESVSSLKINSVVFNNNTSEAANAPVINAPDIFLRHTLHDAVLNRDYNRARQMIFAGANVNAWNVDGQTPLNIAVLVESQDLIDLLIENNAKLTLACRTGKTPLHIAASKKATRIAALLLKKDRRHHGRETDLNSPKKNKLVNLTDRRDQTPLHAAAISDACKIASLLIEYGADVNAKDSNQATPLHYAAINNSAETIRVLIENGADVNAKDQAGQIPENFGSTETRSLITRLKQEMTIKPGAENPATPSATSPAGPSADSTAKPLVTSPVAPSVVPADDSRQPGLHYNKGAAAR